MPKCSIFPMTGQVPTWLEAVLHCLRQPRHMFCSRFYSDFIFLTVVTNLIPFLLKSLKIIRAAKLPDSFFSQVSLQELPVSSMKILYKMLRMVDPPDSNTFPERQHVPFKPRTLSSRFSASILGLFVHLGSLHKDHTNRG
jgi:hypothetical protein